MGKLDENKKIKQEALLSSAFKLFTEKGINNTSISDIVSSAKLAKGTFYLYFKDKYDIRDRLITKQGNHLFENANAALEKSGCQTLEDCVIFIADNVIDQLNENPALLKFISKNLSWAVFSNIRIAGKDNMNCMDIFEELIKKSGRRFEKNELMIFMIVELVNATCHSAIIYKSPVTLEELKPGLYTTIRGIIKQFEVL
ncbi:MAG: TetR/AcrR family transcriptional regulator [Lachnospiraceae bacterium]